MCFITVGIMSPAQVLLRSTHHMPLILVKGCFLFSPLILCLYFDGTEPVSGR